MGEETEAADTQISRLSITEVEGLDENTLFFLDSVDNYLILIETLSSTLRQGWLELASARHSMGASRVNSALLNLKPHSAATTVEVDYDNAGSVKKSPLFSLCKWASSDDKDSPLEKENNEDEHLKENSSSPKLGPHASPRDSENQESSPESSNRSETNTPSPESNGSKTNAPLCKTESTVTLETLVEIANVRSSILKAHDALKKEMKSSNG
ncbi:hypothetical protein Ccrd_013970 [Cynara cardunculus var. scolymus]|uniref:Vacuolar ATPase assembly protein VMA22 n=1 Tax=Cynara cardunculus var. scolymus TaxID=59895 RepID=A0A118K4L0_CYNCS|nr:hypothetical protein Ccrd_013970 [Cynara cardunculus var. scolymus]